MTDIGRIFGAESWAYGINNDGLIVGEANHLIGNPPHAYLWTGAYPTVEIVDRSSTAYGINNRGQVVGEYLVSTSPYHRSAFLWSAKDGLVDIGGELGGIAYAINNRGQIVGARDHAILWKI